jgi:hypothetical protein
MNHFAGREHLIILRPNVVLSPIKLNLAKISGRQAFVSADLIFVQTSQQISNINRIMSRQWQMADLSKSSNPIWIESNGEIIPGIAKVSDLRKLGQSTGGELADLTKFIFALENSALVKTGRLMDGSGPLNAAIRQLIPAYLADPARASRPPDLFADFRHDGTVYLCDDVTGNPVYLQVSNPSTQRFLAKLHFSSPEELAVTFFSSTDLYLVRDKKTLLFDPGQVLSPEKPLTSASKEDRPPVIAPQSAKGGSNAVGSSKLIIKTLEPQNNSTGTIKYLYVNPVLTLLGGVKEKYLPALREGKLSVRYHQGRCMQLIEEKAGRPPKVIEEATIDKDGFLCRDGARLSDERGEIKIEGADKIRKRHVSLGSIFNKVGRRPNNQHTAAAIMRIERLLSDEAGNEEIFALVGKIKNYLEFDVMVADRRFISRLGIYSKIVFGYLQRMEIDQELALKLIYIMNGAMDRLGGDSSIPQKEKGSLAEQHKELLRAALNRPDWQASAWDRLLVQAKVGLDLAGNVLSDIARASSRII